MKRRFIQLVAGLAAASLVVAGCSQAAPAPAPTAAPAAPAAAPTKAPAPAPTKAAAPAPTQAAAKPTAAPAKVDWPQKGKTITFIVPYAAGGSTDVSARLIAGAVEKDLGVAVQVVNKPGGGSQVGNTELALAKPDGYTVGFTALPTTITSYLDPERKAAYTLKSFVPVARGTADPPAIAVKADSPYKSMKDLVDAAKANPDKIKVAASGIVSVLHLTVLKLGEISGTKFASVHFGGGGPGLTALLGGHVDASVNTLSELIPQNKAGSVRILGIADSKGSTFAPGVSTMESQGYKIHLLSSHAISAPAGTPKENVSILSAAIKKALESEEMKGKLDGVGLEARYMGPDELLAYWQAMEKDVEPLMKLAAQQ